MGWELDRLTRWIVGRRRGFGQSTENRELRTAGGRIGRDPQLRAWWTLPGFVSTGKQQTVGLFEAFPVNKVLCAIDRLDPDLEKGNTSGVIQWGIIWRIEALDRQNGRVGDAEVARIARAYGNEFHGAIEADPSEWI